jgi:hypothetical protein
LGCRPNILKTRAENVFSTLVMEFIEREGPPANGPLGDVGGSAARGAHRPPQARIRVYIYNRNKVCMEERVAEGSVK